MIPTDPQERLDQVRGMFARISGRYDMLNRVMTFGRDRAWRSEAIQRLDLQPGQVILDAGSGTGDIALEIKAKGPSVKVVAADLTLEMIKVGKARPGGENILWVVADAGHLPLGKACFSAVISGYLLRNVPDVDVALAEQCRVTLSGGNFVSLDTTPPRRNLLYPFIHIYLKFIIPALGRLLTGDRAAYTYLPETTAHFLNAEALAERIFKAGYGGVRFARRMFGSMAIHWAKKI
jgi:demethylmenaquinone methyltransferase / 2-methoxy-6-polyprenyl-1,4-benzoquinol methylase